MEDRPLKSKNLKIIDHMGTYYATTDGTKMWKIEKWVFKLLMMCDGKKDLDQLVGEITKISGFPKEDIKVGLMPILDDMRKHKMIVLV